MRTGFLLLILALFFAASPVEASPPGHEVRELAETASCRIVEEAARVNQLSVSVLTRLLWNESRFQVGAISRVGAQGVAQFMPGTSKERGLTDPFDPEQAIPGAAKLLADLDRQFGNIGLAIAAYNAGPGRVASWLGSTGGLPRETGMFVRAVTGSSAEEWAASGRSLRTQTRAELKSCTELRSSLRELRFNDAEAYHGRVLPSLEPSGRVLPSRKQSDRILGLKQEQSGSILPRMMQSGRILPNWRQSSRLLPGMEERGQMLSEKMIHYNVVTADYKRTQKLD
jgi:Transglycosylase SLT domain